MHSVLLVDDHPIYLDGLRLTLEREIEDIEIAIAGSVASAMEKIEAGLDPDLILADFKLPDGDGLSLLKATRENHPTIAVGLLCANVSAALVDKCRALGLVACLSKERASDNIAAAVQTSSGHSGLCRRRRKRQSHMPSSRRDRERDPEALGANFPASWREQSD